MIFYLVKFRPFKSEIQQVVVVSDEFVVVGGVALLYTLYHYQYDSTIAYQISVAIISVILLSFVKNICIIMFLAIKKNYIKLRTWIHTKYNVPELKRQRLIREAILKQKKRLEQAELNNSVPTEIHNQTSQNYLAQESRSSTSNIPRITLSTCPPPRTYPHKFQMNITVPQPNERYPTSSPNSNPQSHLNIYQSSSSRSISSHDSSSSSGNKKAIIEQMRNFQKSPSRFKKRKSNLRSK